TSASLAQRKVLAPAGAAITIAASAAAHSAFRIASPLRRSRRLAAKSRRPRRLSGPRVLRAAARVNRLSRRGGAARRKGQRRLPVVLDGVIRDEALGRAAEEHRRQILEQPRRLLAAERLERRHVAHAVDGEAAR